MTLFGWSFRCFGSFGEAREARGASWKARHRLRSTHTAIVNHELAYMYSTAFLSGSTRGTLGEIISTVKFTVVYKFSTAVHCTV